jgi:hypothetical protein
MPLPQPSSRGRYSQGIPVFEDKQNSRKGGAIADAWSPALRRSTASRKMSFYKRPKVFGEQCLRQGIGSFANKAAMIMPELWPCTSAIDCGLQTPEWLSVRGRCSECKKGGVVGRSKLRLICSENAYTTCATRQIVLPLHAPKIFCIRTE